MLDCSPAGRECEVDTVGGKCCAFLFSAFFSDIARCFSGILLY